VLLEYDGDQHREDDQFHRDVERLNDLAAAGWIVIRVGRKLPVPRALDQLELTLRARGWTGTRTP
jgi:very-short-patch-repair endonuclease